MSTNDGGNAATSNGLTNGNAPWWVKAIVQVGIPASLALFLVWYITLGPGGDRKAIELTLKEHMIDTTDLHNMMEDYMRTNTLLMRQLCVNSSKQAGENPNNCFKP